MDLTRTQSIIKLFLTGFLLLFIFAYPYQSVFAVIDTCDGDATTAYTCPAASQVSCVDVQGSQYRTITCTDQSLNGTAVEPTFRFCDWGPEGGQTMHSWCPIPNTNNFSRMVYQGAADPKCDTTQLTNVDANGICTRYAGDAGSGGYCHYYISNEYCFGPDIYGAWTQCSGAECGQAICPSGNPLGLEQTVTYSTQGSAYGYAVAIDTQGNTYVTGEEYSPVNGVDAYVIKYNSSGTKVWKSTYNVPGVDINNKPVNGNESGYGVAVDATGNVYMVGKRTNVNGLYPSGFLIKYDSAGGEVWKHNYAITGVVSAVANAVAIDSTGVYIAGQATSLVSGTEVIMKYDSAGNQITSFIPQISGSNEVIKSIVLSGGSLYTAGYKVVSANSTVAIINKYNSSTGALQGSQPYDSGSGSTMGFGITVDSLGSVFMTGFQKTNGGDAFVQKYNTTPPPGGPTLATTTEINTSYIQGNGTNTTVNCPAGSVLVGLRGGGDTGGGGEVDHVYNRCASLSGATVGTAIEITTSYIRGNGADITVDCPAGSVLTGLRGGGDTGGGGEIEFIHNRCAPLSGATLGPVTQIATPYIRGQGTDTIVDCPAGSVLTGLRGGGDTGGGGEIEFIYNRCASLSGGPINSFPLIYNSGGSQSDAGRSIVAGFGDRLFVTGEQSTTGGDSFLEEYAGGNSIYITPQESKSLTNLTYNSNKTTQEIGFGIAADITNPLVYVTGYSSANGGEMFLNKYSCNVSSGPSVISTTNAQFTADPKLGIAPLTVSVDASNSAGTIKNYEWDWDFATSTNTFSPSGDVGIVNSHTYTTAGTHYIALRITDGLGGTVISLPATPIVVSPNIAPTASFNIITPSTGIGSAPLTVTVDGSASSDQSGGSIASFIWDWGDGSPVQTGGAKTTHIYTNPNTNVSPSYTIRLIVVDNGGMSSLPLEKTVTVTAQNICSPTCSGTTSFCAPNNVCTECVSNAQCSAGYVCKTTCDPTIANSRCSNGVACPADGICPVLDSRNPANNKCEIDGTSLDAKCWVESIGSCTVNADCTASVEGGVCKGASAGVSGTCEYARCLKTGGSSCVTNADCAGGNGICNATKTCDYIYDCVYGPGLGLGNLGNYATSSIPQMPAMPLNVQTDGQACTQPTPSAPNNCQGINGCLYYNYNTDGTPTNSNNSVANCQDKFNGGTGCVYYTDVGASSVTSYPCTAGSLCANGALCPSSGVCPQKVNCLADTTSKKYPGISNPAGIPLGCFVVDKGKGKKDYNCTAIDGCYYFNNGSIDCSYGITGGVQGNGCLYDPNPAGTISCPPVSKTPTAGNSFVQCLLNGDAALPGFVTGTTSSALLSCNTNNDCPANNVCISGTCYAQCVNNIDCTSGQQCTAPPGGCLPGTPTCAGGALCTANGTCPNLCTPGASCTPRVADSSGAICPATGICPNTGCVPGSVCPNGAICPINGQCPQTIPACSNPIPPALCTVGSTCADGQACLSTGFCPLPLAISTTNTLLGLSTSTSLACKYDSLFSSTLFNASTSNLFSITNGTTHTTNVATLPGANTYYAQCAPSATNNTPLTQTCQVSFGVGQPCSTNAQCSNGLQCINGFCDVPYCNGSLVNNTIPPVALASGTTNTTISLQTQSNSGLPINATCKYSSTAPTGPIDLQQYAAMPNMFTTTGNTNHSTSVSSLVDGTAYREYVLCQENASGNIMPLCQIPFSVNVCNSTYQCANGYVCTATTGTGICVPACSNAIPPVSCTAGSTCADGQVCLSTGFCPLPLAYGTQNTAIGLTTNTASTCKYDTAYNASLYNTTTATLFTSDTTQTNHSAVVSGLTVGTNSYYAQCQNTTNTNLTTTCAIQFGVGQTCSTAPGSPLCPAGLSCINNTCQLPVCANASPSGVLASGVTNTVIGMTTLQNANCRYSSAYTTYPNMTPFTTTGGTIHSSPISNLGQGDNTQYVGCQDPTLTAPNDIVYCQIPFSVGTGSQCPLGQWPASPTLCCLLTEGYDPINATCSNGGSVICSDGLPPDPITQTCGNACAQPNPPAWCGGIGGTGGGGVNSCNTLGVTFYGTAITPTGNCSLVAIILALLQWLAWFVGLLAVLSGLRSAYLYVTSVGDQKRLSLAKSYLIYTTIGVAVAVASYGIVAITRAIMGI